MAGACGGPFYQKAHLEGGAKIRWRLLGFLILALAFLYNHHHHCLNHTPPRATATITTATNTTPHAAACCAPLCQHQQFIDILGGMAWCGALVWYGWPCVDHGWGATRCNLHPGLVFSDGNNPAARPRALLAPKSLLIFVVERSCAFGSGIFV